MQFIILNSNEEDGPEPELFQKPDLALESGPNKILESDLAKKPDAALDIPGYRSVGQL